MQENLARPEIQPGALLLPQSCPWVMPVAKALSAMCSLGHLRKVENCRSGLGNERLPRGQRGALCQFQLITWRTPHRVLLSPACFLTTFPGPQGACQPWPWVSIFGWTGKAQVSWGSLCFWQQVNAWKSTANEALTARQWPPLTASLSHLWKQQPL